MKTVKKIKEKQVLQTKKKICAYARVSTGKDTMLYSLSYQISYYSKLIQANNEWLYVGVYSDEAMSGTNNDRTNFQRMIEDALNGKIDMIITKSISRFARNTVTLLETVRTLKEVNVDVYFEEQNLHSISGDGELLLTILASYAQEEARSVSENMKWRIKKNFQEGKPWGFKILGYEYKDGKINIVPQEAAIVQLIYELYIKGKGIEFIARHLNNMGLKTKYGYPFHKSSIQWILKNETYTGNLILQKTYREDYLKKKRKINHGELPKYYVEESHEAIIDLETFNKVQIEIKKREKNKGQTITKYPLTSMLVCQNCGSTYKRRINTNVMVWTCRKFATFGTKECCSKSIREDKLYKIICKVLNMDFFEEDIFKRDVKNIEVRNDYTLMFNMKDGRIIEEKWNLESRSKSWTKEMKEQARIRALKQHGKKVQ